MDNSSPKIYTEFLPISRADMEARGWDQLDFVVVGGDAYVDHPSFGTAIISRLLEAEGYKVGVLAQPRYTDCEDFKRFGKPKYGFFIGGGNVDSMVSHYSVAKIPRAEDEYSPGGKGGARPDRSATVYTRLAKQAYPDLPVILGGLEASLRRFAHYDYWMDTVLPSIAESSGADIISFGMGEHQTVEIARRLVAGEPVEQITDVDGTCYLTDFDHLPERYVECAGFKKVASDKTAYAKACRIQMDNQDVVSGQIIVQKQSEKYLVQNIPAKPLVRWELDKVYALPYTRRYHPIYEAMGGVPAIREVTCIFVDHGLLRKNEADEVMNALSRDLGVKIVKVDAADRFLGKLKGVSDPEQKRKIIGKEFVEVFNEEAKKMKDAEYLAQGTLYTDVIESGTDTAQTIKSHHNVGGLPKKLGFKLIEPLRSLFKDETRELGEKLGIPHDLVWRQPFPGPGLGIRVLGEITPEKLEIVRESDAILREEIKKAGLDEEIWQYFTVLPGIRSVGVMGDGRTYDYAVGIRAVTSIDGMTADFAKIPWDVLQKISVRIVNEVDHVNRILYDVTSKPPSTIEWE